MLLLGRTSPIPCPPTSVHTHTHTADFTFSTIRFCVCMSMCTYLWISVCISLAMFLPPILLNQTHKRRSRITTTISTAHKTNLPPFPVLIFATCALESIQQVDRGRRRCRLFVTINQVGTKRVLQICTKRPLHHQQHQAPTSCCAPKHQSTKVAPKALLASWPHQRGQAPSWSSCGSFLSQIIHSRLIYCLSCACSHV